MGCCRLQPIERATQRDKEAIKQWSLERWPAIKKSRGGQGHHRLGRRGRILSAANGGAHLGTTRADARAEGQVDARSSLGHQWHTREIIKSCSRQCGYSV